MLRRLFCFLTLSIALAGCDYFADKDVQYDDPRNPFYKKAQQDVDANNLSDAVKDYNNALAANPKLAGAHYSLGQIYGDKLNDAISSIYHYRRYLELAPNSDKAADVKALIDKESLQFATSLPNSAPQNAEAYAQLQSENATLKKQVDDLTRQMATSPATMAPAGGSAPARISAATSAPAETTSVSAPTPAMAATPDTTSAVKALPVDPNATNEVSATPSRSYKVVAGDSFWKIAKKMYPGETKNGVVKIKEANKDTVPEGKPLKIGQVLIIP